MNISERISQLPITAQQKDLLEAAMRQSRTSRSTETLLSLEGRDFHEPHNPADADDSTFHDYLAAEYNGPVIGDSIGADSAVRELNREAREDARRGVEQVVDGSKVSYVRRPRPARLYVNRERGTVTLVKVGGSKETRYPASLEAAREIAADLVGYYRARNIAFEIKVVA